MRTASETLSPVLYGTLRTALIGYGVAGFTWLFARVGVIEDPLAASASSGARQLFFWGIVCQVAAIVARWLVGRRFGAEDSSGQMWKGMVEVLADGVTVLLFAIATFRGLTAFTETI